MIREGTVLWHLFQRFVPMKRHVCATFGTPEGKATLVYLARYCHANSATRNEREQGRRDVWLYLNRFLKLNDEELTVMLAGLSPELRHQHFNPGATFIE